MRQPEFVHEHFSWRTQPSEYLVHIFKEVFTDTQAKISTPVKATPVGICIAIPIVIKRRLRDREPSICMFYIGEEKLSFTKVEFLGTSLATSNQPITSREEKFSRIESVPHVCSGAPKIKGRRIRVADIVKLYKTGYTIEDIANWYSISIEDVQEALDYYYEHKEEIDKFIEEEEKELVKLIKLYGGKQ